MSEQWRRRAPDGKPTLVCMTTHTSTDLDRSSPVGSASLVSTVALHLLPGVPFVAVFAAAAGPMRELGVPPIATFSLAALVTIVPLELGYLLLQGRRRTGRLTLEGAVHNLQPLPARTYAVWIPVLFLVSVLLFSVISGYTKDWIKDGLFPWVPTWVDDPFGLADPGRYGATALLLTWMLATLVNGIAAPVVEELYFRGHLLPRLARLGVWAPFVNSVLFALYHFISPWQFFARALGLLPLFYFVWRRSNLKIAIVVHCCLNLTMSLSTLPLVLKLL